MVSVCSFVLCGAHYVGMHIKCKVEYKVWEGEADSGQMLKVPVMSLYEKGLSPPYLCPKTPLPLELTGGCRLPGN